jgi:hypothetical protein
MAPKNQPHFEFVVSTPSHNAAAQEETRQLVRKHVRRRFKKSKRDQNPSAFQGAIILQGEDLINYIAARQEQCK